MQKNSTNPDGKDTKIYQQQQKTEKQQRRTTNGKKSKLDRLHEKYSAKSFEDQYSGMVIFLTFISLLCNGWSLYTSFPYINSQLSLLTDNQEMCNLMTMMIICTIELSIIFSIPKAFAIFQQNGWTMEAAKQAGFYIAIGVCCFAATFYFSYNGSYKTAENKLKKPVYVAPVAKTEQDVNRHYDKAIAAAATTAKQYRSNRLYLGKLQKAEQAKLDEYNATTAKLRNEKITAINNISAYNATIESEAIKKHDKTMVLFESKVVDNGGNLVKYTIVAAMLLLFCYYFREFYDYGTYSENSEYISKFLDIEQADMTTPTPHEKEDLIIQILDTTVKQMHSQQQAQAQMFLSMQQQQANQLQSAIEAPKAKAKKKKKKVKRAIPTPKRGSFLGRLNNPKITGENNETETSQKIDNEGGIKEMKRVSFHETKLVQVEKLRSCKHCKKEYTYNHKIQKYCSDKCRLTFHRLKRAKKKA